MKLLRNISLYFDYLPTYMDVRHDRRKYAALKSHPGMKWMRRMNWLIWFGLCLLIELLASAKRSGLL